MSACAIYPVSPFIETPWFAVKVRSRCEESIALRLREQQYEVITLGSVELRQYSDRVRKVSCALFAGYVFVAMDPENMLKLVTTQGVHYVVRSGVTLQPLSAEETHIIKALSKMDAQQCQSYKARPNLRVGQRVRIEVGPLAGLEGILVRVRDIERVLITVESLNSTVSIEIGHTRVRVLDSPVNINANFGDANLLGRDLFSSLPA